VGTALRNIGRGGPDAIKDRELLTNETRKLFGSEIEQGINMTMDGVSWKAKVNIGQMWDQVAEAMSMGNQPGGVLESYRTLVRGKVSGEFGVKKVMEMMAVAKAGEGGVLMNAAVAGMVGEGAGKSLVGKTIAGINEAIKFVGRKSAGWFRPLLFGAAATAGAVMLLGGPKVEPLEPMVPPASGDSHRLIATGAGQAGNMLRAQYSNHRDLRPEELAIPGQEGMPSAPGMVSPSIYMTNSPALNARIIASGTAQTAPDYDSAVQALRPIMGNQPMNISYHDYRRRLTSQNISDTLEEGY